jgi:hypothetical protein
MALGGGNFQSMNKILPGSYINFISAANASATLSDRGFVAVPYVGAWGSDEVITITANDFANKCLAEFGYAYDADEMKNFREVFKNANTVYFIRANADGDKASGESGNLVITAKYAGTIGNTIKIVITAVDTQFKVDTYLGTALVDSQIATTVADLVNNNFVTFSGTGNLTADVGTILKNGTDDTADYANALAALESYGFNILVCPTTDGTTIGLFVNYTKTQRDTYGKKFQTVVYKTAADHEGVINVENAVTDTNVHALVYWVAGLTAGTAINKSNTNTRYNGEYEIDLDYTQAELEAAIKAGKFTFHRVGNEARVLTDINSFVSFSVDKSEDFASNQIIRILDQIGNDIAVLFNTKYLGKVTNNKAGRIAFWNDIVSYNNQLQGLGIIENFNAKDVVVEAGLDKKSVTVINPIQAVQAMEKLYMVVEIR